MNNVTISDVIYYGEEAKSVVDKYQYDKESEVAVFFENDKVICKGLTMNEYVFRKTRERNYCKRRRGVNEKTAKAIRKRAKRHFDYLKKTRGGGFLFVTFTFPSYVSNEERVRRVCRFFRINRNKRIFYVCVPEFHKSGMIHYHAIIWSKEKFWKRKETIKKVSVEICDSENGLDVKKVKSRHIFYYCIKYLSKESVKKIKERLFGNVFFTNLRLNESIRLPYREIKEYIEMAEWGVCRFVFVSFEGIAHFAYCFAFDYDAFWEKNFFIFAKNCYG